MGNHTQNIKRTLTTHDKKANDSIEKMGKDLKTFLQRSRNGQWARGKMLNIASPQGDGIKSTMNDHFIPTRRLESKTQTVSDIGEAVEKSRSSRPPEGSLKRCSHFGKRV